MTLVRLPSVILDGVEEDFLDATAGSVLSGNAEPFSITDGETLSVSVNGDAPQLIAFNDVDFDDLDQASALEVVAVLNASLVGAVATIDHVGRVLITTLTMGAAGSVEIGDEPEEQADSDPSFDFPAGLASGEDFTEQTLIINRVPEPAESGVPVTTGIAFDIYRTNLPAPANNKVTVTADGSVILNNGSGQHGWTVEFTTLSSSTLHIDLTPPSDGFTFESDAIIDVHVAIGGIGYPGELYSFHTEDLVRPELENAIAQSRTTIRVSFSEPMKQLDPMATSDALNPANYTIDYASRPAVSLQVVSVQPVSPTQVDLVTDIEMTFGAEYELLVVNVQDVAGNTVVPGPDNVLDFAGFMPPFPAGRRFVLADFLPAMNVAEDTSGDLRMFLAVLQEVTNVLLCDIDEWGKIFDPDQAPERFVDAMLADLGNPFSFDLSEVDKRRLLRILVRLYQLKGTQPGIVDSIRFFLGIEVTVETYSGTGWELTEEGADDDVGGELSDVEDADVVCYLGPDRRGLYSFRVVSPVDLSEEQRAQIRTLAEYMKVAHEHYLGTREPTPPDVLDHVVLDLSELGGSDTPGEWVLH